MMMYHPIKCGLKKTSSSVDMVETVIFDYKGPHCDLDFGKNDLIFIQHTPAYDDVPFN